MDRGVLGSVGDIQWWVAAVSRTWVMAPVDGVPPDMTVMGKLRTPVASASFCHLVGGVICHHQCQVTWCG